MALDCSPKFFRGALQMFFFLHIETLETKPLFCQAILKRPPVNIISKSVSIPTIITTHMFLTEQSSANKFWDRSPKDHAR